MNVPYFISVIILWYIKSFSLVQVYDSISRRSGVGIRDLRKFEKIQFKLKKRILHKNFLDNCEFLEVYPKCLTKQKRHNTKHYVNNENDEIDKTTLNNLIIDNGKRLKRLKTDFEHVKNELVTTFVHAICYVDDSNN